jgi:hypothetical protein
MVGAYVNSKLSAADGDGDGIVDWGALGSAGPSAYINEQIAAEYSKEIKILQLGALTIFDDQIFKKPFLSDNKNRYAHFPGNMDKYYPSDNNPITNTRSYKKHKNVLSRSWPLNTKLKDIDNRPWVWYYMMMAYTGIFLTIDHDNEGNYPRRSFPNTWLRDHDFWNDELDPAYPDALYDGTNFKPYNSDYVDWWKLYAKSSGLRKLVKIVRKILLETQYWSKKKSKEGFWNTSNGFGKKDKNNKTWEFNLAIAFMELTIAEAAGLQYDRIGKFDNLPDYFSNPNNAVIFGTYQNPMINVKAIGQGAQEQTFPRGYYGTVSVQWKRPSSIPASSGIKQNLWIIKDHYYGEVHDLSKTEAAIAGGLGGDNDPAGGVYLPLDVLAAAAGAVDEALNDSPELIAYKGEHVRTVSGPGAVGWIGRIHGHVLKTLTEGHGDAGFKQNGRWKDYEFYYPHFLAFERIFRDTESPLNAPPQQIIESFSGDGEKVNKELYNALSFVPDSLMPRALRAEAGSAGLQARLVADASNIQSSGLYNPNILKYELPSLMARVKLFGPDATAQQIQDAIGAANPEAQLSTLADQIEITNLDKSLVYQNTITPISENSNIQINEVKNISKLVKGTVAPFPEYLIEEAGGVRAAAHAAAVAANLNAAYEATAATTAQYDYDPGAPTGYPSDEGGYLGGAFFIKYLDEEEYSLADQNERSAALNKQFENIVAMEFHAFDLNKLKAVLTTDDPKFAGNGWVYDSINPVLDMYEELPNPKKKTPKGAHTSAQKDIALLLAGLNEMLTSAYEYSIFVTEQEMLVLYETLKNTSQEEFLALDTAAAYAESAAAQAEALEAAVTPAKYLPGDATIPPAVIVADNRITNETYNFNFAGKLAPDVHDLIESLYPGDKSLSANFASDYKKLYSETTLEQTNYKAQIFGQLLSKKLNDKLQEYLPSGHDFNEEKLDKIKEFLTIEGFSALQYAYSTQMFAKMKSSRLQNRKFMKKVWKKILKSPLVSDGVDPRCEKVLEKIGVPGALSQNTETDFFKIEEIKPKIIEFYEKTLCKDVYETKTGGQGATRTSLLQGMVRLVIKVYTLEMCLASVIAWDSFDLEDVFKDTGMAAVVLQNISQDFDIEFLSFFATDMLRKENNLTDIQLAELRLGVNGAPQSSMEFLIAKEAESISGIVKSMFVNSFPISTDLQVSLLKNSDPDYIQDFLREIPGTAQNLIENYNIENFAEAGSITGSSGPGGSTGAIEWISDVRIRDNIYTMNYGSGIKNLYVGIDANVGNLHWRDKEEIDIYGLSPERGARSQNNKNYFHSLPMNWYHELVESYYPYSDWQNYAWNLNSGNPNYSTGENFNSFYNSQHYIFGRSDAFSFENSPETVHGNELNKILGNITFEPYVRIEDWDEGEERDFVAEIYSNLDSNGEPCDEVVLTATFDIKDYSDIIDEINDKRKEENNVFKSHIYDYVPLPVWSHFYNRYFLKAINESEALTGLFDNFGLKPFFKKVSFGMRMSYSTANPELDKEPLISSLDTRSSTTPLKKVKSILGRRPYFSGGDEPDMLYELQIPIVEIEKEVKSIDRTQSFVVENSDLIPFSELGAGIQENWSFHHYKNPHQFFYNNLANGMLQEIKNSPEFKLMYDYLFPMRRYMAMASIMASDGLSKFIPNPTDILDKTKQSLSNIIDNISNSTDFKHLPDPIANLLADRAMRAEAGTAAKEPDMTKEILKIVLRTPLLVLKGFVEITDPAVITAKRIIDISRIIASLTLAAIKQGVATAKRIIQSGIDAAKQILKQLEMQLSFGVGFAKSAAAALPKVTIPATAASTETVPAQAGFGAGGVIKNETGGPLYIQISKNGEPHDIHIPIGKEYTLQSGESFAGFDAMEKTIPGQPGGQIDLASLVEIDTSDADIAKWVFNITDPPTDPSPFGDDKKAEEQWEEFKTEFENLRGLLDDYIESKNMLKKLEEKKRDLEENAEEDIAEAERRLKAAYQSPYLLPGIWAAMMPSVIPFGGGVHPFPMPIPFVSTVPGMIYLAILFIDAIEEKMHDDMQNAKDPNCEDQL